MKKLTLFLSLLTTLFTTAIAAEDPAIMNIVEGEAYTINIAVHKNDGNHGLVYYKANDYDHLYTEAAYNANNAKDANYHFVFTKAGNDATGRQLYYISPKNAPGYFAYNKNNTNEGGSQGSVGLTNNSTTKQEKGKWYIFDNGTDQFIVPAWKDNNGTYSRGGCCWNPWSSNDAPNSLGMWGRGVTNLTFDGDACLKITLFNQNEDLDEKSTEIKATTGQFTASNAAGTWHSRWESNVISGLSLSANANNMGTSDDYITGASGTSGTSTYTITAPSGMVVASYSFDFANANNESYSETLNINGKRYASSSATQHVSVNIENPERSTEFTQTGNNKAIKFTNFIVTLQKDQRETSPAIDIFVRRSGDIPYRIPAIAQARNGNLIAAADYRHSGSDIGVVNNGRIDLRARISKNNGDDWGDIFTIIEGKGASSPDFMNVGFGDPCIVADRESDKVLMLSCAGNVSFQNGTRSNHQNIARFYSNDNGETWSAPTDIAEQIYSMWDNSNNHGPVMAMFVGSGKIHQSRYVKINNYYRLYCAVLLKNKNAAYTNFVLYSDDFGGSWKVLGGVETAPVPSGGDEPKVEELPNGNIVLSSRIEGGRFFNIFTFTNAEKAEGSWGTHATSNSSNNGVVAAGNSCNGEIMIIPAKSTKNNTNVWIALQSLPFGNGRANVGIYYKVLETVNDYDTPASFAKDWDGRLQVSAMGSAYSTMCLQNDGAFAFLYEESTYGADYTIIYKKITLENITNGQYSTGFNITYKVDGETYQVVKCNYGCKTTPVDEPTKDGYVFSGWSEIPETMPGHDIEVTGFFTAATAIEEISNEKENIVYDLRGQRIANPDNIENGLYIINGKVVLIKK